MWWNVERITTSNGTYFAVNIHFKRTANHIGNLAVVVIMNWADYAIMLNVFMACYALGKFASGKLYDAIGTRLGFTVSIIVWSLASAFHAFARGVITLSIFRGLLGVGEAGNWPGAVKSNGEWFPVKERAIAQGIFNAGASIGNVIAPFVIVLLYSNFGWKTTYIVLGAVGLLWVIPWLFLNKSTPEKHPWVTAEERALCLLYTSPSPRD